MIPEIFTSYVLGIAAIQDWKRWEVYDTTWIAGFLAGLLLFVMEPPTIEHLKLTVFYAIVLTVIAYALFKINAMGGADWKALMLIAFLTPQYLWWTLIVGTVIVLIYTRFTRNLNVPFIPFLFVAYVLVVVLQYVVTVWI